MREIKFRLWDKEKKVMIPNNGDDYEEEYCYLVMFIGGSLALCWSQGGDVFFEDVSDKYEIMQFTGLKDSKGKEIYEGDIVSWKAEGAIGELEIIGNIYENPELLKEVSNA